MTQIQSASVKVIFPLRTWRHHSPHQHSYSPAPAAPLTSIPSQASSIYCERSSFSHDLELNILINSKSRVCCVADAQNILKKERGRDYRCVCMCEILVVLSKLPPEYYHLCLLVFWKFHPPTGSITSHWYHGQGTKPLLEQGPLGHIQIQVYQCTFSGQCSLRGQKLSSEHKSTRWEVTQHPGLSQVPPHILFPSSLGVHSCHPNEHISLPAPFRWSSKWNTASTHFTLSPEELFRAGTSFTCTFGEQLNGFSWDSFICAVREAEKEVITQSDTGWLSDVQPVWQLCTLLELLYSGEGQPMLLCHWLGSLRGKTLGYMS